MQVQSEMRPWNLRRMVFFKIFGKITVGENSACQDRIIEKNIDGKIRNAVDNAVLTVWNWVHDAILTPMDNIVTSRVGMAVRTITGSSGRGLCSMVQNCDQRDFTEHAENIPFISSSRRIDLNVDQDEKDENRNVGNFEDGNFLVLKTNYDGNAHAHLSSDSNKEPGERCYNERDKLCVYLIFSRRVAFGIHELRTFASEYFFDRISKYWGEGPWTVFWKQSWNPILSNVSLVHGLTKIKTFYIYYWKSWYHPAGKRENCAKLAQSTLRFFVFSLLKRNIQKSFVFERFLVTGSND